MAQQQAKVRRTAAEWSQHVTAWRQSGLSAAAYAERKGLKMSTLQWWAWKLRRDGRAAELTLLPVEVVDEPGEVTVASPSPEMRWELVTAAGDRLCGSESLSPELAQALVTALVGQA